MAITHLRVSNFRCIQALELDVPRLVAIVGPNGAGKSTLLSCFRALKNASVQNLKDTFSQYGGFAATLGRADSPASIELEARITHETGTFDYALALERSGVGYQIADERVFYHADPQSGSHPPVYVLHEHQGDVIRSGKAIKPAFVLKGTGADRIWATPDGPKRQPVKQGAEPILHSIPALAAVQDVVLGALRHISFWNVADLRLDQIRRPQPLEPAEIATGNGENLLSVLYGLKSERRELYEELMETLRVAFHQLQGIELPLAGKGYASLNWFVEGASKPFDAQQLSDGTLRLLWLVTLLHTVPDDGLVLIDEPEISMHPQWLQFLCGFLQSTSARTQIIVATHSDQLIRWLEPNELLIADLEDGISRFRWGHELDLDVWLKDYTLDQLWVMGVLGGRR